MNLEQLIRLTRIRICPNCGIAHAIVRTCKEAELEQRCVPSTRTSIT